MFRIAIAQQVEHMHTYTSFLLELVSLYSWVSAWDTSGASSKVVNLQSGQEESTIVIGTEGE